MKLWKEYLNTRIDREDFLYWLLVRKLSKRGKFIFIGILWLGWIWLLLDMKRLWLFFIVAIVATCFTLLATLLIKLFNYKRDTP